MTQELLSAIQSVGFPIVMCGVMAYWIYKTTLLHKDEVNELREAVTNNTMVIERLVDHIENAKKES